MEYNANEASLRRSGYEISRKWTFSNPTGPIAQALNAFIKLY